MGQENRLLVEGDEDKRVLPELLEKAGIDWGPKDNTVVKIHPVGGFSLLTKEEIASQLKSSGLQRLGILFDADDNPSSRWQAVCKVVNGCGFDMPDVPTATGVVLPSQNRLPRFGVWMMPDNTIRGMLETFLLALCPKNNDVLFEHAKEATEKANQLGAPFIESHFDKAQIHTWLAWRDPPGRQLHQAIQERMLDPTGLYVDAFVAWFEDLFEIASRSTGDKPST